MTLTQDAQATLQGDISVTIPAGHPVLFLKSVNDRSVGEAKGFVDALAIARKCRSVVDYVIDRDTRLNEQ